MRTSSVVSCLRSVHVSFGLDPRAFRRRLINTFPWDRLSTRRDASAGASRGDIRNSRIRDVGLMGLDTDSARFLIEGCRNFGRSIKILVEGA